VLFVSPGIRTVTKLLQYLVDANWQPVAVALVVCVEVMEVKCDVTEYYKRSLVNSTLNILPEWWWWVLWLKLFRLCTQRLPYMSSIIWQKSWFKIIYNYADANFQNRVDDKFVCDVLPFHLSCHFAATHREGWHFVLVDVIVNFFNNRPKYLTLSFLTL